MGNCIFKKKHKLVTIPEKSKEDIYIEEITAYISLEYEDITDSFKKHYGECLIKNKIVHQYHSILNKTYSNPNLFIPLEHWKLRYIWGNS